VHTKGGLGLKGMFADVLEQTLQAEMDLHLGYDRAERTSCEGKKNYRNGTVKRTMKTQLGEVDVNVPRDRNGEFEPQIIGKYQRNADGIEERILSLYATGMSTRDIKDQIKGLYDVEISEGLVSKISERTAGSDRVAEQTLRSILSVHIYGCYPLQN